MAGGGQWRAAARLRARRRALWRGAAAATAPSHAPRGFSSLRASDWQSLRPRDVAHSEHDGHLSVCTSDAAAKNRCVLARTQWLLANSDAYSSTRDRRVLVLTGGAADSPLRSELTRSNALFELERRGHGVFGVREFCQQMLRETGRERRVFGHAQLSGFLLHHADALPVARFHRGTAASSALQRRKSVQDLLALFRLLESEAITPELYAALAADEMHAKDAPADLAQAYAAYRELLVQHNATSWDGLVLDVLALCDAQRSPTAMASNVTQQKSGHFSDVMLRGFTDVVLDDAHRLTPAMARLVGHLCGHPSIRSSTSFSRVLQEHDVCSATQILEQQLLHASACGGSNVLHASLALESQESTKQPPTEMHALAQQLWVPPSSGNVQGSFNPSKKTTEASDNSATQPSAALHCWRFESAEDEQHRVGQYLADRLEKGDVKDITVLLPTHADAQRVATALGAQGLPVRLGDNQFSDSSMHLFDEPGVNAVYSLLCALCFPSDSRHLYNVLRSDFFAFPPELLSRLMEREHGSDADLFAVLEAFVSTRGAMLQDSLRQQQSTSDKLTAEEQQELERGLETATTFVTLIQRLRAECHQLSSAEIAQRFLEATGRMEMLLDPTTPEQELEALALADFLRELETAETIVQSAQVAFVAPYLLQLRETQLSSSTSRQQLLPVLESSDDHNDAQQPCIRVLPLTSYSLEQLANAADCHEKDEASETRKKLLVLMSMRDSKFPGRMKRLTLPLPYELLSEPFPVQTRAEHLERCEKLAFEALTVGGHDEAVLSFATLASNVSSSDAKPKRETLSRTFLPIWHEEDPPRRRPSAKNSNLKPEEPDTAASSPAASTPSSQSASAAEGSTTDKTHLWFAALAEYVRDVVHRFFPSVSEETNASTTRNSASKDDKIGKEIESVGMKTLKPTPPLPSAASTSTRPYEPPHLSYSQISEYLRCPHRYYLSRVMKLPGDVSTAMMFGRALHEGVAAFATCMAETEPTCEPDKLKVLATAEAEEAFARAWVGDGHGLFTSNEQREFLFDRGMKTLAGFIRDQHQDTELQEIVHVEHQFAFHVPEADVELRGVWDRIDRVALSSTASGLVIKEFKSNMGGASRDVRKLADASLQLKIYLYAFRQVFGETPYGAVLQVIGCESASDVESRKKTAVRPRNQALVRFSEEAEQEAVAAIQQVASGLRRADFEPTPSYAECVFCPYAGSACHVASDEAARLRRRAASASRTSRTSV